MSKEVTLNTEWKQNKIYLPSSSALSFSTYPVENEGLRDVISVTPSLEEVLYRVGPLPKKALFLGQAEDELPMLLDLSNPRPGPLLIAGDAGAGKTNLLRLMTRFIVSTHGPAEIQYGVITARPQEWEDLMGFPHCVGIFSMSEQDSIDFIHALTMWMARNRMSRQAFLFIIDGLDQLAFQEAVNEDICKLVAEGPACQIWPIVTMEPCNSSNTRLWVKYFHTRLLGWKTHGD